MRDIFKNKNFITALATSAVLIIIALLIVLGLVWYKRAEIFGYFAKEYIQEAKRLTAEGEGAVTERILEKETIFSQEHFVIDAVKKSNPAVVSIIITKEVPTYEQYVDPNQSTNPFGDLFPGFNFNVPQYRQKGTEKKEVGGGSGFFVSADGLILSNKHVVSQTDVEYAVYTNDGKKHAAQVIARDPVLDIAILKIEGSNFPYLTLGDSDKLEVGQNVIAIGNALAEFRNTVSVGVISGLARSITAGDSFGQSEQLDQVIQTDAAINPGNSGGPLLDLSGKVIGVNVAIVQGSQNIGFALPVNTIKGAIESVKSTGKIFRPYLGIRYVTINAEIMEKNNLSVDYGVLVKAGANPADLAVIPGSPADKAGIVENDIILEVDGAKLDGKKNVAALIRGKSIGQKINLKIIHQGAEKNVSVLLEAAKDS
ncbi:trypsin-like peptidase domain-containing protein [Candidatus Nomurabacteria bacterium]|nr:trypsin-like peptidase domain-containing protein [Candidatus Nomurabacteria bacterium]